MNPNPFNRKQKPMFKKSIIFLAVLITATVGAGALARKFDLLDA